MKKQNKRTAIVYKEFIYLPNIEHNECFERNVQTLCKYIRKMQFLILKEKKNQTTFREEYQKKHEQKIDKQKKYRQIKTQHDFHYHIIENHLMWQKFRGKF